MSDPKPTNDRNSNRIGDETIASTGASASATGDIRTLLRSLPSLKGPFAPVDWAAFPATPQDAFVQWLGDAVHVSMGATSAKNDDDPQAAAAAASVVSATTLKEPHAMTVSTVDADGRPDARVLILKNVDDRGWHFAVKAASPKGRQLQANAACALTFYWAPLGRQVRVRGYAHPLPADECAADFLARPLTSRVSAIASPQSEVVVGQPGNDMKTSENELAQNTLAAQALFDKNPDYVSPGWLVYAVLPTDVEFWQGATDRQHGRLRYVRVEVESGSDSTMVPAITWEKERLWP